MSKLEKFDLSGYVAGQVPPAAVPERTIEIITGEILDAKRVGGESILTIGKNLIEAKSMLSHGEWLPWLTEQVEFSERTAQNFMKLARKWSNPQALADLGATKALVLLALPPEERDAFMTENHIVGGEEKSVIDMSARELEKAIRDREEALAEKNAAEAARAKMAEDMVMVKRLLETAQEERDAALQEVQEWQKLLRASELEATRLSKDLDDLKSRPVEVAVAVDQEAVAKARAEGEAVKAAELQKLQIRLEKTRAEKDKLTAARDEAEEKRKSAEEALAAAQAKLDAAVKAEKSSSVIGADALLAQFQICLEQAQAIVNKMQGLLIKARKRDDETTAKALEKALLALSEKIRRDMQ